MFSSFSFSFFGSPYVVLINTYDIQVRNSSFTCSCTYIPAPDHHLCLQVIIVYGLIAYKPLSADDPEKYPWWTDVIGWGMAGSSMIMIPFVAVYKIVRVPSPASLPQVRY